MFDKIIWALVYGPVIIGLWLGVGFILTEFVRYLGMCQGL